MDNLTIINKLIPLGITGLWVAGGINVIRNAYKGTAWNKQLLNLVSLGVASVFIMSCMTIFTFVKTIIESAAGFITSFDFGQFLK